MVQDVKRGKLFEDYFKRLGWTIKRAEGHIPAYDMILTKGRDSIYIECKYDEM
jgi:hypothetical protein